MSAALALVASPDLARWRPQLAALERELTYPVGADGERFFIDHGADYGAYFDGLGLARFLVASEGDTLLGLVAGALKDVRGPGGRRVRALYGGDLKLVRAARGRGLVPRMFARCLAELLVDRTYAGWRFAFGAAMVGERGDLSRSFRGPLHLGRLARPLATLELFFEPAERLAALPDDGPAALDTPGLDLGADAPRPELVRTTGRKDFRLVSSGAPWQLAHWPAAPDRWPAPLGACLRALAPRLGPGELACFALDTRLRPPLDWLSARGLSPAARCVVYVFPHPALGWRAWRGARWVHLPTSEI